MNYLGIYKKNNKKTFSKLTSKERKEYLTYYKKNSGHKVYLGLPYAELIKNTSGKFNVLAFPHYLFHGYVEKKLNNQLVVAADEDKNFLPLKFGDDTVTILFKSINNQLYLDDLQNISVTEAETIANEYDKLVLKVGLGGLSSGKDVRFLDNSKRDFSVHAIHESGIEDFLIQPVIKQSKTMNLFNQSSINTLRFTTYVTKTGETIVLGVIVRFGKKGSKYDNAHKGGKFVTIDKNGVTSNQARDEFGNSYTEEQLNTRFASIKIPNWDNISSFVKRNHKKLPYHRIIAWDVTINQNNIPKIIEINLREPSLWLHEFDQGTAFGEYTNEVLELIKK